MTMSPSQQRQLIVLVDDVINGLKLARTVLYNGHFAIAEQSIQGVHDELDHILNLLSGNE